MLQLLPAFGQQLVHFGNHALIIFFGSHFLHNLQLVHAFGQLVEAIHLFLQRVYVLGSFLCLFGVIPKGGIAHFVL